MIDYGHQVVSVRTLSGGELVTHGEGAQFRPTIFSIARSRRYLQHGSSGFFHIL